MEKAVLMAGNVQGVSDVKIDGPQAPAVQTKVEYYIIKKGDTLSAIAKQFYGKANDYPKIFADQGHGRLAGMNAKQLGTEFIGSRLQRAAPSYRQ